MPTRKTAGTLNVLAAIRNRSLDKGYPGRADILERPQGACMGVMLRKRLW